MFVFCNMSQKRILQRGFLATFSPLRHRIVMAITPPGSLQNLAKNRAKTPSGQSTALNRAGADLPRHQLCILGMQGHPNSARLKFSMQTSTTDPNSFTKNNTEIVCLSLGALSIIVFLSVAFLWFDATNLPTSNSPIGEIHQPAVKHSDAHQPAPSQDVAVAGSPPKKAPFELISTPHRSLAYKNLNATFTVDKMIWRYTADGWQDISKVNNRSQTPKPLLENVHPAIWTAMLILASLLLLLMFCSQRDVDQLLSQAATSDGGNQKIQP